MSSSYEETLTELYALAHKGIVPGLERVQAAIARLDLRSLGVVHVAGTNGKGSVSRMIAEGIRGERVGLFTSPHLHRLTERVRIDGEEVSREEIVEAWARLGPSPALTFFEAMTVMALDVFARRGVSVAVLETGLGGRLDATNVFAEPRACAITRVGIDHQRFLGEDLASIAREKAGILKRGVPAIVGRQEHAARAVIEAEAARIGAPLTHVEVGPPSALLGAHQRENSAVALGVLTALEAQGVAVDREAALRDVRWAGRLEWVEDPRARFLLDAAHNPDGCAALAAYLDETRIEPRSRALIFGAMADKDWGSMLAVLAPRVGAIVYTRAPLSRAEDPARLASAYRGEVAATIDDAIERAARHADEVIVAGSIFVMAEVRARLLGESSDPPIAM